MADGNSYPVYRSGRGSPPGHRRSQGWNSNYVHSAATSTRTSTDADLYSNHPPASSHTSPSAVQFSPHRSNASPNSQPISFPANANSLLGTGAQFESPAINPATQQCFYCKDSSAVIVQKVPDGFHDDALPLAGPFPHEIRRRYPNIDLEWTLWKVNCRFCKLYQMYHFHAVNFDCNSLDKEVHFGHLADFIRDIPRLFRRSFDRARQAFHSHHRHHSSQNSLQSYTNSLRTPAIQYSAALSEHLQYDKRLTSAPLGGLQDSIHCVNQNPAGPFHQETAPYDKEGNPISIRGPYHSVLTEEIRRLSDDVMEDADEDEADFSQRQPETSSFEAAGQTRGRGKHRRNMDHVAYKRNRQLGACSRHRKKHVKCTCNTPQPDPQQATQSNTVDSVANKLDDWASLMFWPEDQG